ncbi:MFS transporter [Conexibacter woesei]
MLLFAVACGLAVGNAYYSQPLLDQIAATFAIDHAAIGVVVTLTQVGLGLGLLLIVPLGDVLNRRRLVVTQLLAGVAALVVVGTSSSVAVLLIGMAALGAASVVTQVLVAYAAALSTPDRRGRAVGVVTSGVVVGILLARTLAGAITELAGWRAVYLVSAALTLIVAGLLLRVLPREERRPQAIPYARLVRSSVTLLATVPLLRVRAVLALLVFAAFTTLWTALVLPLSAPPHSLSHATIGLFGLAGAAGALAAVRAGRLADRGLGQRTTGVALALLLVSWLPIALLDVTLLALVAGVVLLDLAVQAVHVTNQSMILAANPEARSRVTAAYMVFYSIGSAAGSIAATATYAAAGWTGVCVQGAAISALALTFWAATRSAPARACATASARADRASPATSAR